MKALIIFTILVGLTMSSCTSVQSAGGKRAYAAKAPKNRSAWK